MIFIRMLSLLLRYCILFLVAIWNNSFTKPFYFRMYLACQSCAGLYGKEVVASIIAWVWRFQTSGFSSWKSSKMKIGTWETSSIHWQTEGGWRAPSHTPNRMTRYTLFRHFIQDFILILINFKRLWSVTKQSHFGWWIKKCTRTCQKFRNLHQW